MAYVDFPDNLSGQKERKAFWLSEPGLKLIAGWRRQGTPLAKIAEDYIGISRSAFFGHWLKESEDLRKAVETSKEVADMSVEEALYKRAVGYDYWEEQYELIEGELRLVKRWKKHVPPDVKAILHWLYNRMPGSWRAVQEPLESTQYTQTVKDILVAMKEVAESGTSRSVRVDEDAD